MVKVAKLERLCVYTFIVVSVFFCSYYVGSLYILGDQVHYRKVYENLAGLGLVEGYFFYTSYLDSREFGHFFLSWLASGYLSKDVFISITNSALAFFTIAVFQKWRASIFVAAILVLTNYYLIAMYFSAERLKFAFLFLALSFLYIDRVKVSSSFAFLALITHAQTIIIYLSMGIKALVRQISKIVSMGKMEKWVIPVAVLSVVTFVLIFNQLLSKFTSYYEGVRDPQELLRVLIFFALALWYAMKKLDVVIIFIPLVVAAALFGGDRVNMLGYFAFLYYALPVRRGFNLGILATTLYFALGSFEYVSNVIEYGNNRP